MRANKATILLHPVPEMSRQARAMSFRKLNAVADVFRHGGAGAAAQRSAKGGKCGGGMGGMQAGGVKGGGKRKTHVGGK